MAELQDLTERQLDSFRLMRRVGRGATAEVYLAEEGPSKRLVAVKVLRPDILKSDDNKMLERFRHEAKAARVLNHPNIVQVYSIGEADGFHYIAQEFVHGRNMAELLKRNGPPAFKDTLQIIRQVATALQAAHEAGLVHRDIKPENIMLTREGKIKVTDFGLAQLNYSHESVNLTQEGMTIGTPIYMSPEQAAGKKLDLRTDVYSLGVTAYHMFAGTPPFIGNNAVAIAVQHVSDEPEPLHKRRKDVPEVISRFVHKMMAKDVTRRYQSAENIVKDVGRILQALEGGTDAPKPSAKQPAAPTQPVSSTQESVARAAEKRTAPEPKSGTQKAVGSDSRRQKAVQEKSSPKPPAAVSKTAPETTVKSTPKVEPAVQPKPATKKRWADEDDDDDGGVTISGKGQDVEDMDLTPMVDVTFLLLIFFMITASFSTQKAMEVPAPDPDKEGAAAAPQTLDEMKEESIIIIIDEEDQIFVDDELTDVDELFDVIDSKMQNEKKNEAAVEAAKASAHETFVTVIDAVKEAGIQKIRVAVRTEE